MKKNKNLFYEVYQENYIQNVLIVKIVLNVVYAIIVIIVLIVIIVDFVRNVKCVTVLMQKIKHTIQYKGIWCKNITPNSSNNYVSEVDYSSLNDKIIEQLIASKKIL